MRNYIILNGKDSRYLDGFIVQALPPISKPKIRTQVEEIDGRDGDLVTPLGYSAYDKTLKIGLYGNYRIDDIISYFDSSGVVTFSNEVDKFYRYQIIEQIDFERLVRFRTATLKLHVQPFKYSRVENKKVFPIGRNGITSVVVRNSGNTIARPIITIEGEGNVSLSLNDKNAFAIVFGEDRSITIDTERMEAYNGNVLKNRHVAGDYDNFALSAGLNTISWSGKIKKITLENYARWI